MCVCIDGAARLKRGPCQKASSRSCDVALANPCFPGRISHCVWINVPFAVTIYFQTNVSIEASARDRKRDAYAP